MMKLTKLNVTLQGVAPLLMNNAQTANPLNRYAQAMKKISSQRKKEEEDYLELMRLEFESGLYIDESGPYVPSEWIESVIREGAKKHRLGKAAVAGIFCPDPGYSLTYEGPRTVAELFGEGERFVDCRLVKVQTARVMRTRPRFDNWKLSFQILVNGESISVEDVRTALENAGTLVGLGDYRPKFGRFLVEKFEEVG